MTLSFGFQAPLLVKDIPQFANVLCQAGFSWMEVMPSDSIDLELIQTVKNVRKDFGLHISVHARYLGIDLSNPYDLIRKAAVQLNLQDLEFANDVKAKTFVVHGGNTGWFDDIPDDYAESKKCNEVQDQLHKKQSIKLKQSLLELDKSNHSAELKIALENLYCPWEMISSPAAANDFFKGNQLERICFALDFGHATVSGHSPIEFVNIKNRPVCHVHIHENDGLYDLHRPMGNIPDDWKKALNELAKSTKEVPIIFEWRAKTPGELIESLNHLNPMGLKKEVPIK